MSIKNITQNRRAKFDYQLFERFEAGMVLTGNEIKSIKNLGININEAYVRPETKQIFLIGSHINEYSHSSKQDYNPTRTRKLLLHKKEITKIKTAVEAKGLTVVPLQVYLKNGLAKLEIALAKGKKAIDKRADKIKAEQKRSIAKHLKYKNQ